MGIHCDVFCNGAVEVRECLDIRTVYVGGMVIDATVEEYISAMNLAVDLVNNKTDGFFDGTDRVQFEFLMNYSRCDSETAKSVLEGKNNVLVVCRQRVCRQRGVCERRCIMLHELVHVVLLLELSFCLTSVCLSLSLCLCLCLSLSVSLSCV